MKLYDIVYEVNGILLKESGLTGEEADAREEELETVKVFQYDDLDSQKKGVSELIIFLDDKKSCIVNDDKSGRISISELRTLYPDKILRIEKGGEI